MKKSDLMPGVVAWLAAFVLIFAWALFNWQALQSLHQRWLRFDEPYAIGYPALALSAGWVWRHRRRLFNASDSRKQRSPRISLFALAILLVVLLIGAAAQLVQLLLLQQLVALASLWLILAALLGWGGGRFFIFPFALLSIGIPLWDSLIDPMRAVTVWFTQHVLDMLDIPARIDGFLIGLPAGIIEVAGGCSGLNLFLAMILVGLLFAEAQHTPRIRRVAIVALAGAFGIFENWLRVSTLVIIAYRSELQSNLVRHHGSFGWWIYAIGLLPYFWIAAKIERGGASKQIAASDTDSIVSKQSSSWQLISALSIVMAIVMSGLFIAVERLEQRRGLAEQGFVTPPNAFPMPVNAATWLPRYSGQDTTQAWRIRRDGDEYDVAALVYVEQRLNKKLIYFSNRIADEYALRDSGQLTVAPGFAVNTAIVFEKGWRLIWWFWWVDGATSTNAFETKLLQLRAMLFGDPSAALITVSTACSDDGCQKTKARTQADIAALLMDIRQLQPRR